MKIESEGKTWRRVAIEQGGKKRRFDVNLGK
jgi:hypothetical protein